MPFHNSPPAYERLWESHRALRPSPGGFGTARRTTGKGPEGGSWALRVAEIGCGGFTPDPWTDVRYTTLHQQDMGSL